MGIVIKQSIQNTITTYLGFAIGAVNTLFLYTEFMTPEYYGLVGYLLSTANVMMPFFMFGVSNTLVKFYSSYKTKKQQNSFLTLMLFLPLIAIIPIGFIGVFSYEAISNWLASENAIIKDYTYLIFVIAVAMAYFEVFFAWSKIHFKSAFGNIMKEIFHRVCILFLLLALHYQLLTVEQFITAIAIVYVVRMVIMKLYAFSIRFPKLDFKFNFEVFSVLKYSFLIIIAGSVAMLMLDLDKTMLGKLIEIKKIAYFNVAVFVAAVIAVPARAMHQITYPLTAKYLNENDKISLADLYKKSSLNLIIVSGLIFILIIVNINQLYEMLKPEYSQALYVVIIIATVKLSDNLLGINNSIIFNSNYYRIILFFGVLIIVVAVILNYILIPIYDINGAAIATFLAMLLYGSLKVWYVNLKFKMHPFSVNTLYSLLLILVLSASFYFWEFSFHPIINIIIKSFIVTVIYGFVVYRFRFSEDISNILNKILRR
ncbi:polysaccharide biosynthesis C-terminal domain-containing protein [Lacinutrix sp. Bg11-31]|uniref:oligosaccharide flippase family protein n=1 Tax=Lacinutrix sp. Bg11-31 TaxID=2057808 RepID=UPI000C30CF65|nr:polysaccharide biosynthesis C-terminal domain-containing protein [Lacinutrix sp. Bg11-31]AUC81305.1 sugar isomerase [Lacinutrix sp. Bg11-31]